MTPVAHPSSWAADLNVLHVPVSDPYGGLLLLEREASARGYRRICLTTGPRRPEARRLYLATGHPPLFDTNADPETTGPLPCAKHLPAEARTARTGKGADL